MISKNLRIILGPRPISASVVVLFLYCLLCLYAYANVRMLGFYVVWDQPASQIEQSATAGEWHETEQNSADGHHQRVRILTVKAPPHVVAVRELEDLSGGERRLDFGSVEVKLLFWPMARLFATLLIPFVTLCLVLFGCWRLVAWWFATRRRRVEERRGFEVMQ